MFIFKEVMAILVLENLINFFLCFSMDNGETSVIYDYDFQGLNVNNFTMNKDNWMKFSTQGDYIPLSLVPHPKKILDVN